MARAEVDTVTKLNFSADNFLKMVEKKFNLIIDYSEEALLVSDDLLSLFFKLRRNHYYIAAGVIGAYLGNIIIKNIGGRWSKELTVEKIGRIKAIAQPLLRARKRLANGMQDSLGYYLRSLKLSTSQETTFAEDKDKISKYYEVLRKGGWDQKTLARIIDETEKKYVREEAADILGRIGSNDIVPQLIKALKISGSAYFAAVALQGIPDERSFEPLMRILKKTKSPVLKMQVALALGSIGKIEAAGELMNLLSDDNEIVAHYASMALARIKSDEIVDMILDSRLIFSPGKSVSAIFVLEEIGNKKAVPALIECLFSHNEEVKEAALRAFQTITDERAFNPLTFLMHDKSSKIRTLAAYALARYQDCRVIPFMKEMLTDSVQSVRHHGEKLLYWLEQGQMPPRCI